MKRRIILGVLAAAMVVGMVTMVAVASQDETGNGIPAATTSP